MYSSQYDPDANRQSICASACAYAFAGGTSRFLDAYTGKLGIHQFYAAENANLTGEATQQVSGLIVAYLDEMGIDAKAFSISTIADPNGMIWLTPDDALRLRFANNGDAPPVAEIKLANMTPYLRIQQEHYNVTVRILFDCYARKVVMSFGVVTNPTVSAFWAKNQRRSYLELDGKEFLVTDGPNGAKSNGSVVWITRSLTPSTLLRMANSANVDGWIDGFGAVRWGGGLAMPTVREKITDFAKQCYND